MKDRLRLRTLILSDLHLGTVGCRAKELHRFLKSLRFDRLILAGDIVDFWRWSRSSWEYETLR